MLIKHKDEYKFLYFLGPLDKTQIQSTLNKEAVEKIIINDEKDLLYG
jgi:hypothetical protein